MGWWRCRTIICSSSFGGGFTEGTLGVTGSQVLEIVVGEGRLNSGATII